MVIKGLGRKLYDPSAILGCGIVSKTIPLTPPTTFRLNSDRIYVIIPQFVHSEKRFSSEGWTNINSVFVAGVNSEGHIFEFITMDIEELRCCHYGTIYDHPNLKIPVIRVNDGQIVVDQNAQKFKILKNSELPLTFMEDGRAYINRPLAFKVTGRYQCYKISEIEIKDTNPCEIETYIEEGKEYAKLLPTIVNEYEELEKVPKVDIPEYFQDDINLFISNIPGVISCPEDFQGEYIIPEGVTAIEDGTFANHYKLTSVVIPDTVTRIGERAFRRCQRLLKITIPDSVVEIGEEAFVECSSLTEVEIYAKVKTIKRSTFERCRDLKNIQLPDTLTSIGNNAFYGCSNLASIVIPDSVTSISNSAFGLCTALLSFVLPNRNFKSNGVDILGAFYYIPNVVYTGHFKDAPWGARSLNGYVEGFCVYRDSSKKELLACSTAIKGELKISNTVESIGNRAFADCIDLVSVVIPNSVKAIGRAAFNGCKGLTHINIPDSISSIESLTFSECNKLGTIAIPDTVVTIGNSAFGSCESLTSVAVGNSVTTIEDAAFCGCSNLTYINLPNSVKSIGKAAFQGCSSLESVVIPDSIQKIPSYLFSRCDKIKYLTLPQTITEIGEGAFERCITLEEIILPNSITQLPCRCFIGCENLKSLFLPNNIKKIVLESIAGCKSLTKLIIPEGTHTIGTQAMMYCKNLKSITLPSSVVQMHDGALSGCFSLKEICIPKGQKARFAQMEGLKDLTHLFVERDNEELTILLNLAKAYESGIGVSQSIAQALVMYIQAAEKGSAEAAYHLGEWYRDGTNVPVDLQKALSYFQQAAKSGYPDANTKAAELQNKIAEQKRQEEESRTAEQRKRPKYLFFDTETTGLPPKNMYDASPTRSDIWPRLVQIAWLLVDNDGNILKQKSAIIYPDGFSIPKSATDVHHITTERARREGLPLRDVLEEFMRDFEKAECLVAHNMEFDQHIIGAELYRLDIPYQSFMNKKSICTMRSSTDYCAIPNPNGYDDYKWPKLEELYYILFDRKFNDAHDALADITATKECFFELRKRGIIGG